MPVSPRLLQATPMPPSAADIVVREGFICPSCMQDLGTILELQDHFEHHHTEEDKSFLQQLKGKIFSRKARGSDSPSPSRNAAQKYAADDEASSSQTIMWDHQQIGQATSHTSYFRKIRDSRMERFLVETNKLVIRLDKLVHDAPSDPRQRAAFEKHLASWVPDHDVPICPGCGKTFNLLSRKHHCRLCGAVICNSCSQFLDFDFVERLTNPVGAPLSNSTKRGSVGSIVNGVLKRSNSNESLMSVMSAIGRNNKEQLVRVCQVCKDVLERRMRQMDEKHMKVELEDLHEGITFAINDVESLYPGYVEMAASLAEGETNYQLSQTAELRNRLNRLFETIDVLSKKVLSLPATENPKEEKLRTNIRANAIDYMKSRVLLMPQLPSSEQYEQLQLKRREEIKQRLAAQKAVDEQRKLASASARQSRERELVKEAPKPKLKNPFENTSKNPFEDDEESDDVLNPFSVDDEIPSSRSGDREVSSGWAPEPIKQEDLDADDDLILQQIEIVKKSIQQAKKDGRNEEVSSLSHHLHELNLFYRQNVVQKL